MPWRELGTLVHVASPSVGVEGAEIINRNLVRELAHITPEASPAVDELHEGVDIRAAATAANDATAAELRHGDVLAGDERSHKTRPGQAEPLFTD